MIAELKGHLVTLAREYRELSQVQVAEAASIRQGTLAKIETGTNTNVSDSIMERIAQALRFPIQFFYLDEYQLDFGSSSYYYRKRSRMSAGDRKFVAGLVNLHRIVLSRLMGLVDLHPTRTLPSLDLDEFACDAREIARHTRVLWSLPDGPIRNVTKLMESAGVLVVPCDFRTRQMDATSIWLANSPPMVFINKDLSGERWRFTLAHELGHLVMHTEPSVTMESEADAFAGEFLAPHAEIKAQLRRLGRHIRIADLLDLKPYWKVSAASLLMRASEVGLVTPNQKRYLWAQMSQEGYTRKEPVPIPREEPKSYSGLIAHFVDQLGYTVAELARTVSLSVDDLAALYEGCLPRSSPPVKLRIVK